MKPKINTIFLDIDNVLNRQSMASLEHVGCLVDVFDERAYPVECGYDILAAANELHGSRKFAREHFWNLQDREFWATIPKSEEFHALLDMSCELVGIDGTCLLSVPVGRSIWNQDRYLFEPITDPLCAAGKVDWINTEMPKEMRRNFFIGPNKDFAARPDALLIDDHDQNVIDFRKAGGHAILMPRPWNSLNGMKLDTMDFIRDQAEAFDFPARARCER